MLTRSASTTGSGIASNWRRPRGWPRAWDAAKHLVVPIDLRAVRRLGADGRHRRAEGRAWARAFRSPTFRRATPSFCRSRWPGRKCWSSSDIFIGVNAIDYSGYPDCRPEFIAAFERMANLATKAGVEGRTRIQIHTPLIQLSKSEIIKLGRELGVDFGLTHSCYDPDERGRPCGLCDSCRLRLKGFADAGLEDPLEYRQ